MKKELDKLTITFNKTEDHFNTLILADGNEIYFKSNNSQSNFFLCELKDIDDVIQVLKDIKNIVKNISSENGEKNDN